MNIRIKTLVAILVIGIVFIELKVNSSFDAFSLISSAILCFAMVGLIYFHARKEEESPGFGALILQSVIASIACSVAMFIILHITLLVFGVDLFDWVHVHFLPMVVFLLTIILFPFCWRVLK